ncbi:hypothetical protein [Nocardia tengchongensis]|uniref:hypothetical protein n=1 Tax=Nocardia tengchongensis TaxID=2055889 RepID=UPI00361EA2FA
MRAFTAVSVALAIFGGLSALPATASADQELIAPWARTTPVMPVDNFTALIAYAFGYAQSGSTFTPGTINEQLADTVVATLGNRSIPVYAQTEIAEVLKSKYGMRGVISVGAATMAEVESQNPRTQGVAQTVANQRATTKATDVIGVIAFQDHLWRATQTTRSVGFHAYAPKGISMPNVYAADNTQDETRTPDVYRPIDTVACLPFLIMGGSSGL